MKTILFKWAVWAFVTVQRSLFKILGISTLGVRAIVIRDEEEVLLVKHTYIKEWHLPGGGVNPNETVYEAVQRELKEETGVTCHSEPKLFDIYFHILRGAADYPIVFTVDDFKQEIVKSPEIQECRWFSWNNLPMDTHAGTKLRIFEFFERAQRSRNWN